VALPLVLVRVPVQGGLQLVRVPVVLREDRRRDRVAVLLQWEQVVVPLAPVVQQQVLVQVYLVLRLELLQD
jgi:hypothetical protein